jgi:hypothetical protein
MTFWQWRGVKEALESHFFGSLEEWLTNKFHFTSFYPAAPRGSQKVLVLMVSHTGLEHGSYLTPPSITRKVERQRNEACDTV